MSSTDTLKAIDLFAGIGGIRLGFEQAFGSELETVFVSEWDKFATQTYQKNFNDSFAIEGDIRQISASDIPDFDILLAGFPCQPFSIAGVSKKKSLGRSHGFADKTQGTLFFEIARIIKEKQPKIVFLENVKNLVSHDKGKTFKTIKSVLEELGYHVHWHILDAKNWTPQHRERIYIVCFKDDIDFNFDGVEHPVEQKHVGDILVKKPDQKYTLSDRLWNYLQDYSEKHKAKGNGFGYGLVTKEDTTRTLSARYYKDGSEILVKQRGKNPRKLTPRECARLQGFPDTFKIPVSDTQAYKQFGNSVCVPAITAVANEIKKAIE